LLLQHATKVVRSATRLHRHDTGRKSGRKLCHGIAAHTPSQHDLPACVQSSHAAAVFAQINPQYRNMHRSAPSACPASLSRQGRGAGHPIKAGEGQAIGRSRGGLSTKIHALVDALGNPVGLFLTGGEAHDLAGADHLLPEMQADTLIADKAFDADQRVIEPLAAAGKAAVIPPRSNRRSPRDFDRDLYKLRHLIENFFAKLKQFRAIATRYDKTARNFLAGIHLVASAIWLI
jgi:transposase